jgi:hypothetical protein
MAFDLPPLYFCRQSHDDSNILLPNGAPEILDRVGKWNFNKEEEEEEENSPRMLPEQAPESQCNAC